MGRNGTDGYLKGANVKSGQMTVYMDSSGNGSGSVTFTKNSFKNVPRIILSNPNFNYSGVPSNTYVENLSTTRTGFSVYVYNASQANASQAKKADWVAVDFGESFRSNA